MNSQSCIQEIFAEDGTIIAAAYAKRRAASCHIHEAAGWMRLPEAFRANRRARLAGSF
ncbi:hypothetical protein LPB67_14960 [Undibacterium sp. Jales W-56]|uniref:hypothetical protein n=1 Tax=Undibacterium sp. Jales W-56 TaxID=2897325 RepID=UPI0021D2B0DD|nr:hypothetical protein [Undibacterium sp. Jales W-56]MCU6435076.1 hypothetical protein [Undibacterium sp. Jales W-56]